MVDVGGGTGFCTQGIVKTISPINVVLMDQSPQQLAKAKKKKDLQGVTIVEVQLPSAVLMQVPSSGARLPLKHTNRSFW